MNQSQTKKEGNIMEERKLNEKESLELITRMIQNTKDRMAENSGTPFLLWGYVTVIENFGLMAVKL